MIEVRNIILILLLTSSLTTYAQHIEKEIELQHLQIEDSQLNIVLDSIIDNEKKCSYYDCELIFAITTKNSDEKSFLIIDSLRDKNIALVLKPYGYFYNKDHLFLVDGDTSSNLFSNLGKKRKFKYLEYDPTYQETGTNKKKIHVFTDDSFSQWEYWYVNGEIVFKNKSSSCD